MSRSNPFGKIPEDQAIEEAINKRRKIPGCIVEESRNPDSVSQWVETTADRSQITENIRRLVGQGLEDESSGTHQEASTYWVKIDESDIRMIMSTVERMVETFKKSNLLS